MTEIEFDNRPVIFVEGKDDRRFISALARMLNINVQLVEYEGVENLKETISGALVVSSFRQNVPSFGVTRDADTNGKVSAIQSVTNHLRDIGVSLPEYKSGGRTLRVSLHVMCNSQGQGALEDMILEAIATDWRIRCIDDYFDCLEQVASEQPAQRAIPRRFSKARLQVFLGSLIERPATTHDVFEESSDELRVDFAVQRRYLNLDHPVYDELKAFLQGL